MDEREPRMGTEDAQPPTSRRRTRLRRGIAGMAAATAAVAALTASQAPGLTGSPPTHDDGESRAHPGPWLPPGQPGDGQYHTEIPPLDGAKAPASGPGVEVAMVRQAGIPATVLAAYMRAEKRVDGSDPGCHLPWQLLAAIGKVESGQARGGDVDKNGDTRHPILGPVLNGAGFANISDTDNGRWDGDRRYDRAVGPMQFIPSTWQRWGADGNGDGVANPNNVFDAALAAGDYLCAGDRDLATRAGLERAVLSYNYSRAYLRTVLSWLAFYRSGVHVVPNGTGPLPSSPGAGSAQGDPNPKGGTDPGGGIEVGPQPSGHPHPGGDGGGSGDPGTDPGTTGGSGSDGGAAGGTGDGGTGDGGTGDGGTGDPSDPGTDPGTTTGGSGDDGGAGDGGSQSPCPSDSASPSASPTPSDTASPSPSPSGSPDPCTTPAAAEGA